MPARLLLRSCLLATLLLPGSVLAKAAVQEGRPSALLPRLAFRYDLPALQGGACAPASVPSDAPQRPRKPWLAPDKAAHAVGSFLIVLSSQYVLTSKTGWSETDALPLSVGTGALAGLSKEAYDWQIGSSRFFSWRDLVADAAGIALAVGVITL